MAENTSESNDLFSEENNVSQQVQASSNTLNNTPATDSNPPASSAMGEEENNSMGVDNKDTPPTNTEVGGNESPPSTTEDDKEATAPSNTLPDIEPLGLLNISTWEGDPIKSKDWDRAGTPGPLCAGRVKRDIANLYNDPLPGIFVCPKDDNLFVICGMIIGPFDTPYEGGFFHFLIRFGPQYPLHPPRVRFLTTSKDTVRFNPNLYASGKVCLSILGTWSGPPWSPASNLGTVLLSLQSLLNEKPYHNEPGFETELVAGDSDNYNKVIQHETLRVAVCEQLENFSGPTELYDVMKSSFHDFYDYYVSICNKNMAVDGQPMNDPFERCSSRGIFRYKQILDRLKKLKETIQIPKGRRKSSLSHPSKRQSSRSTSEDMIDELPDDDDDDDDEEYLSDTDSIDSSSEVTYTAQSAQS